MKKRSQREAARDYVLGEFKREVERRQKNTRWPGICTTYRREIARLWRAALRAVESA